MTKEQEVFEKVNRIRIDFFDSKYKDVHTDDELEEKYEALGDVLNMLKEKDNIIKGKETVIETQAENEEVLLNTLNKKDKQIDLMARAFKQDDVRSVEEIKKYFERKSEG